MIRGKAVVFGDNVDTDVIIPARYLTSTDPKELGKHCMEGLDPHFPQRITPGATILVAGKNFGCGSSREHAPLALKGCGVSAVVAASFARIFFRNAINIGLPILESEEAARGIREGDMVSIDLARGEIRNETTGEIFWARPFPPFLQEIIAAGGLMNLVEKRVKG
ncbi:3-isopropylmalate dehydratase small subunit [Candidatus Caldatribacterium saccharofermentans]|uniref:3-isopropylmalate dehydratase small subunit n=1 Tax=Candidatus Caldatribacterium saccharofermentans TaxID=1454753 RepID=UPI003D01CAE2